MGWYKINFLEGFSLDEQKHPLWNISSATLHQEKKETFEHENGEQNFRIIFKVCFTVYLLS